MSYTKTVWSNGATALSDTNMNHIEQGIYDAHVAIDAVVQTVATALFPVGSIYLSTVNTNPGTFFPNTTWVAWGSGKVPVGVDANDTDFNTVEKTGGEKTHTLTTQEMPTHNHTFETWAIGTYSNASVSTGSETLARGQNRDDMETENAGGGQAHNNLQPYITCYMWKRTA